MDLSHVFFAPAGAPGTVECEGRRSRPAGRDAGPAPGPGPAADAGKSDPLMALLLERAGIDADVYQPRVLARRVQACLRRLGVGYEEAAKVLFEARPEGLGGLLDVALIGVSAFFRDREVFERLRCEIEVGPGRRSREMRVLSAGCSDGQELYSMAILLDESVGPGTGDLLGVDCRPAAILRAQRGRFAESQLVGLSPGRKERYFERRGEKVEIRPFLKARTRWRAENLFRLRESSFDVILCRNVAIYLTASGARDLWASLAERLAPGGVLVTGKAERPSAPLPLRPVSSCIYRRAP